MWDKSKEWINFKEYDYANELVYSVETFGKLEKDDESKQLKKNHISNVLQILSKCDNLTMRLKVFNKLLLDKGIRNPNKNLRYMLALLQKDSGMVSSEGSKWTILARIDHVFRYSNHCQNGPFFPPSNGLRNGLFWRRDYVILARWRNANMGHFVISSGQDHVIPTPKWPISKGQNKWAILTSVWIFSHATYLCHSHSGCQIIWCPLYFTVFCIFISADWKRILWNLSIFEQFCEICDGERNY